MFHATLPCLAPPAFRRATTAAPVLTSNPSAARSSALSLPSSRRHQRQWSPPTPCGCAATASANPPSCSTPCSMNAAVGARAKNGFKQTNHNTFQSRCLRRSSLPRQLSLSALSQPRRLELHTSRNLNPSPRNRVGHATDAGAPVIGSPTATRGRIRMETI